MRIVLATAALVAMLTVPAHAVNLTGQAFLQPAEGSPRTCAGQEDVVLLPDAAQGAIDTIFGTGDRGFLPASHGAGKDSVADPASASPETLYETPGARRTTCDANGNFAFANVSPGRYFLMSRIVWSNGQEGGTLFREVTVTSQVTNNIILSGIAERPAAPIARRDPREILVEDAIRGTLVDPGSAQFTWPGRWAEGVDFREWRWSRPVHGDFVCGRVNARNRMGGFTGPAYFMALVSNGAVLHLRVEDDPSANISVVRIQCQGRGF